MTGGETQPVMVKVWDPLVRVFHWSLVALFLFAFISGDNWEQWHEWSGYTVAGLLAIRIVWGVFGTRNARFSSFTYRPAQVLSFLKDTLHFKGRRYLGHNPAGGAMIIALLVTISGICLSGYLMTTDTFWGVEWVNTAHKIAVNTTLALIILHIGGVVLASVEHAENLVKAMFSGMKRAE